MKRIIFLVASLTLAAFANSAYAICAQYAPPGLEVAAANLGNGLAKNAREMTPEQLRGQASALEMQAQTVKKGDGFTPGFLRCVAKAYSDAADQKAANEPSSNNARQASNVRPGESNASYRQPSGQCVSMTVQGDAIMAQNNCGVPVVGQFCFDHSQLYSCSDSVAAAFGPLAPGQAVMIATTADTMPRGNEWRYSLCNAEAAQHNQCRTHHP